MEVAKTNIINLQNELIGTHPIDPNFFANWLLSEDILDTPKRRHRKLLEHPLKREVAIDIIKDYLIKHHIDESQIERFKRKKEILDKRGYSDYIKNQHKFPKSDITQRGNCAEVILSEYLKSTSLLESLVYRLRYNTNVEQSMKGDDVLLLNILDLKTKIIVGEAKFRSTPDKTVVNEITKGFGSKKLPLSLPFLAQVIRDKGDEEFAESLEDLNAEMHYLDVPIINVGFLLSNSKAANFIELHGDCDNDSLVLISLGIDDPCGLVKDAFDKALDELTENL